MPKWNGSGYPAPFDVPCADRIRERRGDAGGITDFGINLMHLPPGSEHNSDGRFVRKDGTPYPNS